jgi:transcriptional regulator NrdR family protein
MNCPKCGSSKTEALDSRRIQKYHGSVRRRKICNKCYHSWTTYEIQQKYIDSLFEKDETTMRAIKELHEHTQSLNQILARNFGGDTADPSSNSRGSL